MERGFFFAVLKSEPLLDTVDEESDIISTGK